jgi:hypothetical protein
MPAADARRVRAAPRRAAPRRCEQAEQAEHNLLAAPRHAPAPCRADASIPRRAAPCRAA